MDDKIPTLYQLACRAYNPGTTKKGYKAAFKALFGAQRTAPPPDMVIHRISIEETTPDVFWHGMNSITGASTMTNICNPFLWRVAYVNTSGFDTPGPTMGRNENFTMAVIEDSVDEDYIYPFRNHTIRGATILSGREAYHILVGMVKSGEDATIESRWFEDRELPLRLVDGAPESRHHAEWRHRIRILPYYCPSRTRRYLEDPKWKERLDYQQQHTEKAGEAYLQTPTNTTNRPNTKQTN